MEDQTKNVHATDEVKDSETRPLRSRLKMALTSLTKTKGLLSIESIHAGDRSLKNLAGCYDVVEKLENVMVDVLEILKEKKAALMVEIRGGKS